MHNVELLDIDGSVVVLKQFEYVLYLYEKQGLTRVSLIRYLKNDGYTEREAINLALALEKWNG